MHLTKYMFFNHNKILVAHHHSVMCIISDWLHHVAVECNHEEVYKHNCFIFWIILQVELSHAYIHKHFKACSKGIYYLFTLI